MEKLDLSSLKKATVSLKEVAEIFEKDKTNAIVRDSLIQRFEYTYSLSLKMLKRFFIMNSLIDENIEDMTFNSLIRNANKNGLLMSNLEKWNIYRLHRNMTSHTYDEEVANKVVLVTEDFLKEAQFILKKLEEKANG